MTTSRELAPGLPARPRPAARMRRRVGPPQEEIDAWFADKDFTQDWLSNKLQPWFRVLGRMRTRGVNVLEIGSFEGRSAVFFLSFLSRCKLTCVDHFPNPAIEARFDENLAEYEDRLTKIKSRGIAAMDQLIARKKQFDVIYLDAGKERDATFALSSLAWCLLKPDGVLIWDDFAWSADEPSALRPHDAITLFKQAFGDALETLHEGRQLIVRKTEEWPRQATAMPA